MIRQLINKIITCRIQPEQEFTMIKKELLDILACPQCKNAVRLNEDNNGLICEQCRLLYEIRDDIPIMLIDEAKPLDKASGDE